MFGTHNEAQFFAATQSQLDLAACACALERYRLAQGHLPQRLDDLIPRYLGQFSRSIQDASEFRYQPAADETYELWTRGWFDPRKVAGGLRPEERLQVGDQEWPKPKTPAGVKK
jgi:hypothetical protein